MLFLLKTLSTFTQSNRIFTKQAKTMIREILTLVVDKISTQYYIDFDKDRKQFNFKPTLSNKAAPSFKIIERYGELIEVEEIDASLLEQAKEKIREILNNPIFDHL
jgi:hypothetical protein